MRRYVGIPALFGALTFACATAADDKTPPPDSDGPPPQLRKAGEVVAKVVKASDKSIVIKLTELTLVKSSSSTTLRKPRLKQVEKDYTLDMSDKVTIRFRDLPLGPNGKPRQYTPEEIGKLREPVTLPGYKAEVADLKAGTVVRATLSKVTRRDDPLVTAIMILQEAPPAKEKPPSQGKTPKK